jgi:hypothetical protein
MLIGLRKVSGLLMERRREDIHMQVDVLKTIDEKVDTQAGPVMYINDKKRRNYGECR